MDSPFSDSTSRLTLKTGSESYTYQNRDVLVCHNCNHYYNEKDGWKYCPECSEGLVEVPPA